MTRSTHTEAQLAVSSTAYEEIRGLLTKAGYDHLIDTKEGSISMHGLQIIVDQEPTKPVIVLDGLRWKRSLIQPMIATFCSYNLCRLYMQPEEALALFNTLMHPVVRRVNSMLRYGVRAHGNTPEFRAAVVHLLSIILHEVFLGMRTLEGIPHQESDYKVICDETNNPPLVVDSNQVHVNLIVRASPSGAFVVECRSEEG